MKYSIMGFDQKTLLDINEQGHKIDVNDLLILRWLVDFSHTDKMAKLSIGSNTYYWVSYQAVLNDLPLLQIGRRMLAVRLKKMVDAGILTSYLQKSGGTFTMYGFGKRFQSLISSDNKEEQDSGNKLSWGDNKFTSGCQNIDSMGDNELTTGVPIDLHPKDSSTKNYSTRNESNNTDSFAKPKRNHAEYSELFERFWKAYPKKVAKGTAAKAFKKAKVDESLLQDILKALEWQRETKQWKAEGGQYIPNPATYLNGRRWEDEQEEKPNGTNDISGTCEYKLDVLRL